jgi:hypothetical protein
MFGRNSVIGGGATLDGSISLNQAIGQAAGVGAMAECSILRQLVTKSESLRWMFVRHEHMAYAHAQQVAACNAVHEVEKRLSRWLLQARDLLQSDDLPLTQEFLSVMLGVQRSSVTIAARHLQDAGLIDYRRGLINILNVEHLRDYCCECYAALNDHFSHLTGWVANVEARGASRAARQ